MENQKTVFAGYDPASVMQLLMLLNRCGFTQEMISQMGKLPNNIVQQIKAVVLGCGRVDLQAADIVDTNEVGEVDGCEVIINHAVGTQLICNDTIKLVKTNIVDLKMMTENVVTFERQRYPNCTVAKTIYNDIDLFCPFPELEVSNNVAVVFLGTQFRSPNGSICFSVLNSSSNECRLDVSTISSLDHVPNVYFAVYNPSYAV